MTEIGIDPTNTSKRLGHASSQMTLDIYTHTTKTGEQNSIKKICGLSQSSKITIKKDVEVFPERYQKRYQKQKTTKKHLARDLQNACNR